MEEMKMDKNGAIAVIEAAATVAQRVVEQVAQQHAQQLGIALHPAFFIGQQFELHAFLQRRWCQHGYRFGGNII